MTSTTDMPICSACKLLRFDADGTPTCAAFPKGIPHEIISEGFDHRKAFRGDHGIRFDPDPEFVAAGLLMLYERSWGRGHAGLPPESHQPAGGVAKRISKRARVAPR